MEDYEDRFNATERTYHSLYRAMMQMYANDDGKGCFRLAAQLLATANLPPLIRVRCYMLLSTKIGPLAVQHAEMAVKLLDERLRGLLTDAGFNKQWVAAQKLLEMAKERESAASLETAPPEVLTLEDVSQADHAALGDAASSLLSTVD
ncbi:hypothetical protein N0V94_009715 [Neodidymelliopsis sp. IMI 364377]|nr:hypothetical protein N0V94_009715 [Neodidymelliopsis sp. IMI 364377]